MQRKHLNRKTKIFCEHNYSIIILKCIVTLNNTKKNYISETHNSQ